MLAYLISKLLGLRSLTVDALITTLTQTFVALTVFSTISFGLSCWTSVAVSVNELYIVALLFLNSLLTLGRNKLKDWRNLHVSRDRSSEAETGCTCIMFVIRIVIIKISLESCGALATCGHVCALLVMALSDMWRLDNSLQLNALIKDRLLQFISNNSFEIMEHIVTILLSQTVDIQVVSRVVEVVKDWMSTETDYVKMLESLRQIIVFVNSLIAGFHKLNAKLNKYHNWYIGTCVCVALIACVVNSREFSNRYTICTVIKVISVFITGKNFIGKIVNGIDSTLENFRITVKVLDITVEFIKTPPSEGASFHTHVLQFLKIVRNKLKPTH